MRIAIFGKEGSWYCRDLERAARGIKVDVVPFCDLEARLDQHLEIRTLVGAQPPPFVFSAPNASVDAVFVRTMPLGSTEQIIFRMNALHSLERCGTRMINPPRCLEIAIDKWLTLEVLHRAGLPCPKTVCCQTRDQAMEAFDWLGGHCVVKPLFGGEGRGIMRVDDPDMAWRVFSNLEQLNAVIYLQEFVYGPGYDLRLLVVGKEVYCVRRHNPEDWRTNVSRGGQAVAWEASDEQRVLAQEAARAIGGLAVGVDIMPTAEGANRIIEVNAVPGWRATARALKIDIAEKMIALATAPD